MNCPEIQELLSMYVDDELDATSQKAVQEHLAACPQCQAEMEMHKGVWGLLEDRETIEPSADYVSRFWTRLSVEEQHPQGFAAIIKHLFLWKPRLLPVLSITMLLALFATLIGHHMTSRQMGSVAVNQSQQVGWEAEEFIEFSQNAELIENLEFFDNLDVIEQLGA